MGKELATTLEQQNNELNKLVEPTMQQNMATMWNDVEVFNRSYKFATILAQTTIVPEQYKGKVGDCLVAIDIANRMGLSPMVVMQNSQLVKGNFSWKGSACKAMIDSCGRYKKTVYQEVGDRNTDSWGFYLEATDNDDNIIKGVVVTIGMAKAEGWYQRNEKWKTMPELMLKYRASAFFMRTECASVSMGFLTSEENEDIDIQKKNNLVELLDEEINEKDGSNND